MQIYDFIKQRMANLGYDSESVVITPITIPMEADSLVQIGQSGDYLYLYDCINYRGKFKVESDVSVTFEDDFIIGQKVPSGIVELYGNVYINTLANGQNENNANVFMLYSATPAGLKEQTK